MATKYIHTQVVLPCTTGLPEDSFTNDFSWITSDYSGYLEDLTARVVTFYNDVQVVPGDDNAVAAFIGAAVPRTTDAIIVNHYDVTTHLSGTPAGSPVSVGNFTLGAAVAETTYLPTEVAVKATWHADLSGIPEVSGATRPKARRRGGLFLGPLTDAATTTDVLARPTTNLIDVLNSASEQLRDGVDAELAIWSKADATMRPVVGGWVDNAFDTQRRRGIGATSRTSWSL